MHRIEARPCGEEAPVPVASRTALFSAGEVEERLGEFVTVRPLTALDRVPRFRAKRNVVAEAHLRRADRVEHPTRAPLHALGNHDRIMRAQCTSAGFGSSHAHTASTYGGRCSAGGTSGAKVIAQRFPCPFIRAGGGLRPTRSRYAIRGRSTPQAAASPCQTQRRGFSSISLSRSSR